MSAYMSHKICAVIRQPDRNATVATDMLLSPRSQEMATRSATARLEKRRAELGKLQTTSHAFKEARSVVPRGTGTDKLWFKSGQYWGKAYTIGVTVCSIDWSMLQHMTHGERVRKRYAEWRLACSQGHNPTV